MDIVGGGRGVGTWVGSYDWLFNGLLFLIFYRSFSFWLFALLNLFPYSSLFLFVFLLAKMGMIIIGLLIE